MKVGSKIKEIREKSNISQVVLAEKVGTLTQSQICKIESGKRHIRVNEVVDIAKAFNVHVKEILT
ncbi:helix-turn-helix domain-containing protein [Clostridium beijerinckii]|uniref:helix-turn-helix domain-containing protein n=1 Tax=Clostridium beijerinckii TaxID=1520 RepID=UPI0022279845|nr:helix-turn-helix transcriptional regulator [Clostridium beijerinckii]UYZ37236.1 helix-turn-helix domain-containing protein [Clostridium beijerinckii]